MWGVKNIFLCKGKEEERNRREDFEMNRRSMNRSTRDPAGKDLKNNFDPH